MKKVYLLTAAIGVVGSNSLTLSPIAPRVAETFHGVSSSDVMVASACYGAATALGAVVLAPLADRWGAQRALICALAVLVLSVLATAWAPGMVSIYAAQSAAGLAAGVVLPAAYGLAADYAPKGKESDTLGKVLVGWTLSFVAGVSLSSYVAEIFGWRTVFVALATLGAIVLALTAPLWNDGGSRTGKTPASVLSAIHVPNVGPLLVAVWVFMAAFYGLYSYLGTQIVVELNRSTSLAGIASAAYGAGFFSATPFDRLIDRFGGARVGPVVFFLAIVIYLGFAGAGQSGEALVVMCFIWGGVNHLGLNLLIGRLASLDASRRSAILGLNSAVTYVAMAIGTASFKPVFDGFGFEATALLSAACMVPALYVMMRRPRGSVTIRTT